MSKKVIFLIFCIVAQTLFSQKYEFDYMLKNEHVVKNPKYYLISYMMLNSENRHISMFVINDIKTGVFSSILIDDKNNTGHHFTLGKVMEPPFIFNHTDSFKLSDLIIYQYKELKIHKIGDLHYKIKVQSREFDIELKLEPYEADLILIHFENLNYKQSIEIENLIKNTLIADKQTGNFYIKEITYRFKWNNEYREYSEKSTVEKVNVQLDL